MLTMAGPVSLEVSGRQVSITHPDKVVFERHGRAGPYTKLELVRYYLSVAEGALRGVTGRPMILKRFVKGISEEAVFQKRAPTRPAGLRRRCRIALRARHFRGGSRHPRRSGTGLGDQLGMRGPRPAPRSRGPTSITPTNCASTWIQCRASRGSGSSTSRWWPARCWRTTAWSRGRRRRGRGAFTSTPGSPRAGGSARCGWPPRPLPVRSSGGRRRIDKPVVEGGARGGVRRLQPERQGPHRRVGVFRPGDPGCPGVDAAALGRGRRLQTRGVHHRHRARPARRNGRPVGGDGRRGWGTRSATDAGRRNGTSGARAAGAKEGGKGGDGRRVSSKPLIEIARTKTRDEAMAALDTWRDRHPAAAGLLAAGRRPGRRHAWAEFDLVPDPDQPAARAGRPAAAAGRADRRLQPLGRGLGPAPWLLSLIRERTASASASGSERPVCGPCRRVVLVTVVGGEQRPKPIGGAWAQEFEDPSTQLVYLIRPALEGMRHATAALFSPDHPAANDIGAAYGRCSRSVVSSGGPGGGTYGSSRPFAGCRACGDRRSCAHKRRSRAHGQVAREAADIAPTRRAWKSIPAPLLGVLRELSEVCLDIAVKAANVVETHGKVGVAEADRGDEADRLEQSLFEQLLSRPVWTSTPQSTSPWPPAPTNDTPSTL